MPGVAKSAVPGTVASGGRETSGMIDRALASPLIALAALAGCSARDAAAPPPPQPHTVPTLAPAMPATVIDPSASARLRSFEGRDADHDGVLTPAESAAAADSLFDAIDRDGDGEVDRAELDAARQALGLEKTPSSRLWIARADQDGDGELTLGEWIAQEARSFRDADRDHDGVLSKQEFLTRPMLRAATPSSAPAATDPATAGASPRP